jgi:hypothetical protein
MFRINPARLVYRKFRATIASGIAGNNVPTIAIVIPLSKKYFYTEFINFMRFVVPPPDGGNARRVALSTGKQDDSRAGDYLARKPCPKKDGASSSYKSLMAVRNLHHAIKDSEPRLKIGLRIECWLGSRGDVVTGLRVFVTRIRIAGIPEKQKPPKVQFLSK